VAAVSRKWWILIGAVVCLTCACLLPCSQEIRDGEGWTHSANSIHQIGLALRNYHKDTGHLPQAVVRGKDGTPLYSWRVLILPYLDDDPLLQRFHLDEPWGSEHNGKLLTPTPRCFRPLGGDDADGLTRYQVFVGPGTAFEGNRLTWDDFPDGLANTLLVVEAGEPVPWSKPADLVYDPAGSLPPLGGGLLVVEAGEPVPWSKPADLVYDPAGSLPPLGGGFGKPVHFLCYELWRNPGFTASFADGSTSFIRSDTNEKTLRGFITRNGGEKVDRSALE
jgi:hypothetical protein